MTRHSVDVDKYSYHSHSPVMTFFDSLGAVLGTTLGMVLVVVASIAALVLCCLAAMVMIYLSQPH